MCDLALLDSIIDTNKSSLGEDIRVFESLVFIEIGIGHRHHGRRDRGSRRRPRRRRRRRDHRPGRRESGDAPARSRTA